MSTYLIPRNSVTTTRAAGIPVVQVNTQSDLRGGTESIFDMLVVLLLIVGIMLVAVGSLGLMGAMSLNVIERTREIGVMRAIGASNGIIARIVIVEGLVIGLLSWVLGGLLALPPELGTEPCHWSGVRPDSACVHVLGNRPVALARAGGRSLGRRECHTSA